MSRGQRRPHASLYLKKENTPDDRIKLKQMRVRSPMDVNLDSEKLPEYKHELKPTSHNKIRSQNQENKTSL